MIYGMRPDLVFRTACVLSFPVQLDWGNAGSAKFHIGRTDILFIKNFDFYFSFVFKTSTFRII